MRWWQCEREESHAGQSIRRLSVTSPRRRAVRSATGPRSQRRRWAAVRRWFEIASGGTAAQSGRAANHAGVLGRSTARKVADRGSSGAVANGVCDLLRVRKTRGRERPAGAGRPPTTWGCTTCGPRHDAPGTRTDARESGDRAGPAQGTAAGGGSSSSNRAQYHNIRGRWNGPFHMVPFTREEMLPSRCR